MGEKLSVKEKELLNFFKGLTEYIIEHSGIQEKDRTHAVVLRKEIRECLKHDKQLGSWWRLLAHSLFTGRNIKDERINPTNLTYDVSFTHNDRDYVVNVGYINFDVPEFPKNATLTQNVLRQDEAEFIEYTMKRFIDRHENCDTSKVGVYKNYVLLFTLDDEEE